MHEEDRLDRMLESSLSSYGDPGMDSGLAERVLARISSEQSSDRSVRKWRSRFLLWAALPAAACLLLTFLLLKSSGPRVTHPLVGLPESASRNVGNKAPRVEIAAKPVPKTVVRPRHQASTDVAKSVARPKQDVFPLPQPLSPEEQALIAIATAPASSARENLIASQRQLDAPLEISAINIPSLTKSDQDLK